jgi:hypothetical protein
MSRLDAGSSEASGFIFWSVESGALGVKVKTIPDNIFT